jgi:hypothetical protein
MSSRSNPDLLALRLAAHTGITIAEYRRSRRWTIRDLADRARVSPSMIHAVEHGRPASLETYAAIAVALGLEPRLELVDPRRRAATSRAEDPVHAAMGEILAARLAGHTLPVAIDEPYQHFQFAGRADVLAWDLSARALLHVENRTRFPNLQDAIGSYNAKRRYLPAVLADRLGVPGGWASVTNVMVGLWSSEVIHVARIRRATFAAVCPDSSAPFDAWWQGSPPPAGPPTSSFVLLDPTMADGGRGHAWVGLDEVLETGLRPRLRGYADAAAALGA